MCAVKLKSIFVYISLLCFMVFSIHNSNGLKIESLKFKNPNDYLESDRRLDEAIDPLNDVDLFPNLYYTNVPGDLCALYDPPLPDFRAPGRRISESKCFEYNWRLKIQAQMEKILKYCKLRPVPEWSNKIHRRQAPLHFDTRFPDVHVETAKRGELPNMGAIGWKTVTGTWSFLCGGSLISSKFVLTAAHCSEASKADSTLADVKPKIVRLGSTRLDHESYGNTPFDANIINVIVHPEFKSPKQYFDIALMELAQEVVFSEIIQPACLWTKNDKDTFFNQAKITGWNVESGLLEKSAKLLVADVDIIDSGTCNGLLQTSWNRNWCGLADHQMCAGKLTGGVDTCRGDSGGPLQVNIPLSTKYPDTVGSMNYVVGVTAFGVRCGLPQLPGVYTRVDSFIDWIESIVWPDK